MFTLYRRVREKYPHVILLGFVSFFADVASEMLYPITPIFLTSILGSSMASVGLIEGIAEGLASLLKTYAGFWSDKIVKRKPFILAGYALSAISRPMIGFSTTVLHVLLARTTDRVGKGLRIAPRDALLADQVEAGDQGLAFGLHRSIDTWGAVIGPLLVIVILMKVENLRAVYYWSLIPGIVAVYLITLIHEPKPKSELAKPFEFKWKELNPEFKSFLISWGMFCFTNSSDAFLILKMKHAGLALTPILLIYAFYNVIYASTAAYFGHYSDKIGKLKMLSFGLTLFTFVYAGFAFATQPLHFLALFAVYALYIAATDGVTKAYVSDLVGRGTRGSALGILGTVTGIGQITASLVTGLLWDHYGSTAALLFSCSGSVLFVLFNARVYFSNRN